jgi:hypothetical protein
MFGPHVFIILLFYVSLKCRFVVFLAIRTIVFGPRFGLIWTVESTYFHVIRHLFMAPRHGRKLDILLWQADSLIRLSALLWYTSYRSYTFLEGIYFFWVITHRLNLKFYNNFSTIFSSVNPYFPRNFSKRERG